MKLVLLTLLPTIAVAAPPPTAHRASVLLVPMDKGAEANAPKLESYMIEAMEAFPGLTLKKPDDLFGIPVDAEAEASLKRAEQGYEESRKSFDAGDFEDAERKLRATLKEYSRAGGALTACGHYCDALVMYAVVLQKRGDTEEAKLTLLDLIALAPTYEVDAKRMGKDIVSLRAQVATSRSSALRGTANVRTRPGGGRVYLDGQFKGYAPLTLNTLPVGKHLLRIERPGFKRFGQIIEVTPDEIEINADLEPTAAWRSWDGQMDQVATDALKGGGASMVKVGKTLALDRAVLGTIKAVGETGETEVALGVYDLRSGKRLSGRRVVYQGDEYGQLKSEVAKLVNALLIAAEGGVKQAKAKSSDPLEGRSGMEDWSGEDRGGRNAKKKGAGDPLDGVNGMEDW